MIVKRLLLTLAVASLCGCGTLPNAGPSATDVIDAQQARQQATNQLIQRYTVLDIDPRVIEIMRMRRPASFFARFGDYRPSASPVIDKGDIVSVTIWETTANGLFSTPLSSDHFTTGAKSATLPDQAVGRDGAISVPYAGHIRVAGLTTTRVQDEIIDALKGKAIQPQVLINVTHPVGNTVTVTGEVGTAARVPLSNKGDRLLDVLAGAGGTRIPADDASVQLSRGNYTLRMPLTRVIGDPRENIFMRAGDTMTILRRPETFMAMGASGQNQQIPFAIDKLTLSQAMAKMGGLIDNRANPAGVFVFRYEPAYITSSLVASAGGAPPAAGTPVAYRLNLADPNTLFLAQQFPVFDNDVIYISDAPITDLTKVFSAVGTIVSPATRLAISGF